METVRLICDTREQLPHPWEKHLPAQVTLERGTLETGDFCLKGLEDGAIVERKTVSDLLGCITRERDRFERELKRGRHCGAFCVVVEGSLQDCLSLRGDLAETALVGSVASWTRRYCPFVFCGGEREAAQFAWRFLQGQVRDAKVILNSSAN